MQCSPRHFELKVHLPVHHQAAPRCTPWSSSLSRERHAVSLVFCWPPSCGEACLFQKLSTERNSAVQCFKDALKHTVAPCFQVSFTNFPDCLRHGLLYIPRRACPVDSRQVKALKDQADAVVAVAILTTAHEMWRRVMSRELTFCFSCYVVFPQLARCFSISPNLLRSWSTTYLAE